MPCGIVFSKGGSQMDFLIIAAVWIVVAYLISK